MVMRLRTRNKATPTPPQKGPTALGQGSTMDPSHQGTSTVASGVSKPSVVLVNPLAAEFFFNLLALKEYFHSWNHV